MSLELNCGGGRAEPDSQKVDVLLTYSESAGCGLGLAGWKPCGGEVEGAGLDGLGSGRVDFETS
jgi:hypothetical protein